ncbi:MAG: hypothetical protein CMH52_04985 [Myxococcales bacterium]|nr:hypothetical protein [Myxococcales bacterium]
MLSLKASRQTVARELHYGRTDDGWRIAVHRLPHRHTAPKRKPVLLCHGLGANRYNLDAPGDLSLANWLWKKGHDCWVVELRGAGQSSRPNRDNGLKWDWCFEDYVDRDIPVALDVIARATGRESVHWIGHSMGGMIGYAYLIRHGGNRVASLSAIGSPSFSRLGNAFLDKILGLRTLVRHIKRLPYEGTGSAMIPFIPVFKETFGRLFGNPRNLRSRDLAKIIRMLPSDLPTTLIMQFADWYEGDGFATNEGGYSYIEGLERITTPTQLIVGDDDKLAPPDDIQFIYDQIKSEQKRIKILGQATGCRFDYGHVDPVLGKWAPEEVWPLFDDWIDTASP